MFRQCGYKCTVKIPDIYKVGEEGGQFLTGEKGIRGAEGCKNGCEEMIVHEIKSIEIRLLRLVELGDDLVSSCISRIVRRGTSVPMHTLGSRPMLCRYVRRDVRSTLRRPRYCGKGDAPEWEVVGDDGWRRDARSRLRGWETNQTGRHRSVRLGREDDGRERTRAMLQIGRAHV